MTGDLRRYNVHLTAIVMAENWRYLIVRCAHFKIRPATYHGPLNWSFMKTTKPYLGAYRYIQCIQHNISVAKLGPGQWFVPLSLTQIDLISTWISNHMLSKMWDWITYSFPCSKSCVVQVLTARYLIIMTKSVVKTRCCVGFTTRRSLISYCRNNCVAGNLQCHGVHGKSLNLTKIACN